MIKYCQQNKDIVLNKIKNKQLDNIVFSNSSFVDDIIHEVHKLGVIDLLGKGIEDKRADNTVIPFNLVLALSIASKMKVKTSLTDIPYAIQDHRLLSTLGYNLVDREGLGKGLMAESSIRFLVGKYDSIDFIDFYNNVVQNFILPHMDIIPDIHILDCTKIAVNIKNDNYEGTGIALDNDGNTMKGYKLSTIRGIVEEVGVIEDIRFGSANIHDLNLSEEMLRTSPCLKEGDILIEDRGFLSRNVINYLKTNRKVNVFVPLRRNMDAYNIAIELAKIKNQWQPHPNKKRPQQVIALVKNLGEWWNGGDIDNNVDFNGAVVWDKETNNYFVFITTDLSLDAKRIIQMYELRPEIEEDYRQLKDFWKLEDFKSTKLNVISFHIVCVLLGYLFFQLYVMTPSGEKYAHKSLPIIVKNYVNVNEGYLVIYSGDYFCTISVIDFMNYYADCDKGVRDFISKFM